MVSDQAVIPVSDQSCHRQNRSQRTSRTWPLCPVTLLQGQWAEGVRCLREARTAFLASRNRPV